jgi:hypothetical protein
MPLTLTPVITALVLNEFYTALYGFIRLYTDLRLYTALYGFIRLYSAGTALVLNDFSSSGVRSTEILVSFADNVVGMGLTAEDCGIVDSSRLTVTFIDDKVSHPVANLQS